MWDVKLYAPPFCFILLQAEGSMSFIMGSNLQHTENAPVVAMEDPCRQALILQLLYVCEKLSSKYKCYTYSSEF